MLNERRSDCVDGVATGVAAVATPAGAAEPRVPVVEAAKEGDHQALRALVARKADVNASEADGTTALHWAARSNDEEAVRLLVGAGANVNAANRYGVTPLPLAAGTGNATLVETLLKAGADPNADDRRGSDGAHGGRTDRQSGHRRSRCWREARRSTRRRGPSARPR